MTELFDMVYYAINDLFGINLYDTIYYFISDSLSGGTPYSANIIDITCIFIVLITIIFIIVFTIKFFLFIIGKVCDLLC